MLYSNVHNCEQKIDEATLSAIVTPSLQWKSLIAPILCCMLAEINRGSLNYPENSRFYLIKSAVVQRSP